MLVRSEARGQGFGQGRRLTALPALCAIRPMTSASPAQSPLRHPVFARLFTAQVISLLGTGLMTIALGLVAYRIAGAHGGLVLGTALAIKMIAYVTLAPIAQALTAHLPRRGLLITLDLFRAGVALALPFVDSVWQIYILIFLLQAASAAFTPTFQSAIPDILPDEARYTRALSLSQVAEDLENVASPALAALLLALVPASALFFGTAIGFALSAMLVAWARPPRAAGQPEGDVLARTFRGIAITFATPRLRGLLALDFVAAAGGAMVIVNTPVITQGLFGRGETAVALATGLFGAGSMTAALLLPRVVARLADRSVMLGGAGLMTAMLAIGFALRNAAPAHWALYLAWMAAMGLGYSAILTPSGRLLPRSASPADLPTLYSARFALSHACWLVTYPLAGTLGAWVGMGAALAVLGLVALAGTVAAAMLWPRGDASGMAHRHNDLPRDHPHLAGRGRWHSHPPLADGLHAAQSTAPVRP